MNDYGHELEQEVKLIIGYGGCLFVEDSKGNRYLVTDTNKKPIYVEGWDK